MKYNLCYFSFSILTIMYISPFTLAAWTKENPPMKPLDDDLTMSCPGWIIYHGFLPGNTVINASKAMDRASYLDGDAFPWAVGYAYVLSGLGGRSGYISPEQFCENRKVHEMSFPYSPLSNEFRSCPDWMFLYGYELDNISLNWQLARYRNLMMDDDTSHWVTGYGQVLASVLEENAVSPQEYCDGIGIVDGNNPLPFFPRKGSKLACDYWIKLYGFTDDSATNYEKSLKGYHQLYYNQIHYVVKSYAAHLFYVGHPSHITPWEYCDSIDMNNPEGIPFYSYVE